MKKLYVLDGEGKRAEDLAGELGERIKDLVGQYAGRMTLATAIGVLHIVAKEIIEENA